MGVALLVAVLAGPAYSQAMPGGSGGDFSEQFSEQRLKSVRMKSVRAGRYLVMATEFGYQEEPLRLDEVRPAGLLRRRMEFSLKRLLESREEICRFTEWGADHTARWVGAVSALGAITGSPVQAMIEEKVKMLLEAQDAEGVFCGQSGFGDPRWFGQATAIWFLLEYYHIYEDEKVLAALMRAADAIVKHWGNRPVSANLGGTQEWSLAAYAVLGQQTERNDYVEYARHIARSFDPQAGKPAEWLGYFPESDKSGEHYVNVHLNVPHWHHTHTYLQLASGLVDLSIITNQNKYLGMARKIYEDTLPSVWLTGGLPEHYNIYSECGDETCSAVSWIQLCAKLANATGDCRYYDAIELTTLNHLLWAQGSDGAFYSCRAVNRQTTGYFGNRGFRSLICCTMSGSWNLPQVAMQTITANAQGFAVNLPLDVDGVTRRHGRPAIISQRVEINAKELVQKVQVNNGDNDAFRLRMRVPYWCKKATLEVNGQTQAVAANERTVFIECPANSKRSISLRLPMMLQIVPSGRCLLNPERQPPDGIAPEQGLQYGPFVLMLNREMYPQVKAHDVEVTVAVDMSGQPTVVEKLPADWPVEVGAIPLLVKAQVNDGTEVFLTPCGNLTMTGQEEDDVCVVRFTRVTLTGG
ncbi:glycoside hydrolase family 127 protein [Pirellulales bacterium]|nr:glycoside hydrolase family 127 protein [Pirellulales bacterium]